jgi:N-acyl-D-aspartate/D-glutamate deacylase
MTWDVLIRRSVLIDGSGSPGTVGDIALAAGRIAAIGGSVGDHAKSVVDAEGLAVTPGFIDIKTRAILLWRACQNFLVAGLTVPLWVFDRWHSDLFRVGSRR